MKLGPRSFVGGEVSDRLFGRPDDPRYNHGCEILENAVVTATGVAQKRGGTRFVRESRNSADFTLLTYRTGVYNDIWIEFGLRTEYPASSSVATYLRFHTQAATVLHSTVWSATTAYAVDQLVQHPTTSGTLYRCKVAHTNQAPPSATYWDSLAYSAANDYAEGDLVSHSGTVYYCRVTHTSASPVTPGTESHWYAMPATGEYEIPTLFAHESRFRLFADLTWSQQGSVLTMCANRGRPQEVELSGTTWFCRQVSFAPTLAAPTGVAATATKKGNAQSIYEVNNFNGSGGGAGGQVCIQTTSKLSLANGEIIYVEGSGYSPINGKYWRVAQVQNNATRDVFDIDDPETGARLIVGGGATSWGAGGTVRITRLNGADSNTYVVTAVDDTGRESVASSAAPVANNLDVTGARNTISWSAVSGASRYRVYKLQDGTSLYGFIGQTDGLSFVDDGIAPRLAEPPPILDTSLNGRNPRAVAHFEGRRWFAYPLNSLSQNLWGTKTNTESDLSYGLPLRDTDRISQRVKARYGCGIRHLVPMSELIVLTDTTEFRVTSPNSDALTPESFVARPQSYIGAGAAQPDIIGNVLLFAEARGGHIMQMGYSTEAGGYVTASICERATHLFDRKTTYSMSCQRAPVPVLWVAQESRERLLGCTFIPTQQVLAWHRHTTDGLWDCVRAGLDNSEDRVYVGVTRTIDGQTKRYIERIEGVGGAWSDSWYVDCGLRYQGAATSTVSGLDHLEGKTVKVFADGLVQTDKVVAGGAITLDTPAESAVVGLGFRMVAKSVPATFAIEAFGSSRPKNVGHVSVRVSASGAWLVGLTEDQLDPAPTVPGVPFTGQFEVRAPAKWTDDGQLVVVSDDPTPLNVVSYTADVEVAG